MNTEGEVASSQRLAPGLTQSTRDGLVETGKEKKMTLSCLINTNEEDRFKTH